MKHLYRRLTAAWRAAAASWASTAGDRAAATGNNLPEVLERSADGVIQLDAAGHIRYVNTTARQLLGLAPGVPLRGLTIRRFATARTMRQLRREVSPALAVRGVWLGQTVLRLGPRGAVPFSLMALSHNGADGQAAGYSAVLRDISADVQARQQVQRQNNILSAITEALPATVVIVDQQGRYRFVNSAFERMVGRPASQILGRTAVEVLGADEVARRKPYMLKAFAGEAVSFALDYPGPEGVTWLSLSCIPLNLDGQLDGFVGISQDVTAQRLEQERLARLAERDPLTGLLNRAGLAQRAAQLHQQPDGAAQALLYIDLDHFKPVNDQFGHEAGDRLLQMFAQRLSETVRSSDLVARLGGDEFAVLLTGVHQPGAVEGVADKVLAVARAPFEIDGRSLRVSASIGTAAMRDGAVDLRALLSQADTMLYRAKAAGRGRQMSQPAPAALRQSDPDPDPQSQPEPEPAATADA